MSTEADVVSKLKDDYTKFTYDIVDEILKPNDAGYLRYNSVNPLWISGSEVVKEIDENGNTTIVDASQYTVNLTGGYITFGIARPSNHTIWCDYSFYPFTDAQLLGIVQGARLEIQALIWHSIPASSIADAYIEAIIKKSITHTLRSMQMPTIKYFSISIGGRSISKEQQIVMINSMIENNEKELLQLINSLRYYDKTNVMT